MGGNRRRDAAGAVLLRSFDAFGREVLFPDEISSQAPSSSALGWEQLSEPGATQGCCVPPTPHPVSRGCLVLGALQAAHRHLPTLPTPPGTNS